MPSTLQVINAAVRIGRATPYGFLTTLSDTMQTRLVQHLEVTDQAAITFSTDPTSRKAMSMGANPHVTYAIFDHQTLAALTVYGSITFDRDRDRRFGLWHEDLGFFYDGPDDDRYVLVTIQPRRLEVWSLFDEMLPPPLGFSSATIERTGEAWSEPFGTYPGEP